MKASELIETLTALIQEHGDLHVVSGVARSGYGETVEDVTLVEGYDVEGLGVVDLVLSDESSVII